MTSQPSEYLDLSDYPGYNEKDDVWDDIETRKYRLELKSPMTHTPGPWTLAYLEQSAAIKDSDHRVIAVATWAPDRDVQGNALLMAAAPDLLAACEALVGAWDEYRPYVATNYLADAIYEGRAAIAKAKGE